VRHPTLSPDWATKLYEFATKKKIGGGDGVRHPALSSRARALPLSASRSGTIHVCHMRRRIHACHMRRRIHACHMRRRIHACHMRRRIHACHTYEDEEEEACL